MASVTKSERLTKTLLLLQDRSRTCAELAELLEVSRRTVLRDLEALGAMGIPVLTRDGAGGGVWLAEGFTARPLELEGNEALLLMLALDGLARLGDTPFAAARETLLAKVRALVPEGQRTRVAARLAHVAIEVPPRSQRAPHLDALAAAVGEWVEMEYDGEEGVELRTIRVDRILADAGLWYVEGFGGGRTRRLRADRVLGIRPTAPEPTSEPPRAYDDPSHPEVVVTLTRRGLRRLEREPHLGHLAVGREAPARLAFRCPPSELDWYARYFGGMGDEARFEAPEELIQRVVAEARKQIAKYSSER